MAIVSKDKSSDWFGWQRRITDQTPISKQNANTFFARYLFYGERRVSKGLHKMKNVVSVRSTNRIFAPPR
jgi:hypothetical protein